MDVLTDVLEAVHLKSIAERRNRAEGSGGQLALVAAGRRAS